MASNTSLIKTEYDPHVQFLLDLFRMPWEKKATVLSTITTKTQRTNLNYNTTKDGSSVIVVL